MHGTQAQFSLLYSDVILSYIRSILVRIYFVHTMLYEQSCTWQLVMFPSRSRYQKEANSRLVCIMRLKTMFSGGKIPLGRCFPCRPCTSPCGHLTTHRARGRERSRLEHGGFSRSPPLFYFSISRHTQRLAAQSTAVHQHWTQYYTGTANGHPSFVQSASSIGRTVEPL